MLTACGCIRITILAYCSRRLSLYDPSLIFRAHQLKPADTLVRRPRPDSLQLEHDSSAILIESSYDHPPHYFATPLTIQTPDPRCICHWPTAGPGHTSEEHRLRGVTRTPTRHRRRTSCTPATSSSEPRPMSSTAGLVIRTRSASSSRSRAIPQKQDYPSISPPQSG